MFKIQGVWQTHCRCREFCAQLPYLKICYASRPFVQAALSQFR